MLKKAGFITLLLVLLLVFLAPLLRSQDQPEERRKITILAIGAHAGDMEISCGALLAKQVKLGDRVVLLHLTLGEGGNPRMAADDYGRQKRKEAEAAAAVLGADVIFGKYRDGELPGDAEAVRYVVDVIRQVKPSCIITHWKDGLHRDHVMANYLTREALLLASLPSFASQYPAHRGVRRVLYTENWEDKDGFFPYTYFDTSDSLQIWEKCVKEYELFRGGISSFPYFDYYRSLSVVRGAESGFSHAVAFDIDSWGKKQALKQIN